MGRELDLSCLKSPIPIDPIPICPLSGLGDGDAKLGRELDLSSPHNPHICLKSPILLDTEPLSSYQLLVRNQPKIDPDPTHVTIKQTFPEPSLHSTDLDSHSKPSVSTLNCFSIRYVGKESCHCTVLIYKT